jgi:Zn-dependent protease with chaperone function
MGATILGDTIYISKNLNKIITPRERLVVLAHELAHYKYKDRLLKFLFLIFTLGIPKLNNLFSQYIENRADEYAIKKTKDPDAFISLLDVLNRKGSNYPSKEDSIKLANNLRGKL